MNRVNFFVVDKVGHVGQSEVCLSIITFSIALFFGNIFFCLFYQLLMEYLIAFLCYSRDYDMLL